MKLGRLLLIADYQVAKERAIDLPAQLAAALSSIPKGAAIVQVRAKNIQADVLSSLCKELLPLVQERECKTVINTQVELAIALGADGVHLPEEGSSVSEVRKLAGDDFIIGRSTHSAKSAAASEGADYIVCGPCWPTASKPGWPSLGQAGLREVLQAVDNRAPLFAIGGVTEEQARIAAKLGVHGVAAIRHWLVANNPAEATRSLYKALLR